MYILLNNFGILCMNITFHFNTYTAKNVLYNLRLHKNPQYYNRNEYDITKSFIKRISRYAFLNYCERINRIGTYEG